MGGVVARSYAGSAAAFETRRTVLPGGVTGAGRVDHPFPIIFERAQGKWLTDIDGNTYLDFHGGYGTAVLGYGHPAVDAAVQRVIRDSGSFVGVAHRSEGELAERLCDLLPEAEMVAFCGGGGSDAVYHAVRLARAVTGRPGIIKVEGGYHGWHSDVGASTAPRLADPDPLGAPEPIPNSRGILPETLAAIRPVPVNDPSALRARFAAEADQIAAVIVEPVLFSSGCVAVDPSYLALCRELCDAHGAVLIFDEVLSGFRVNLGGAGAALGVLSDLSAYGKAIANGHVMSALVGRASLIDELAPGPVFYSGTFNGHPVSVAAAQATIDELSRAGVYEDLGARTARLAAGINSAIDELQVNATCAAIGSVWNLYLRSGEVRNYRDLARSFDATTERLTGEYRHHLRDAGIFMQHRFATNRCFLSVLHDDDDVRRAIEVTADFLTSNREELSR